MSLFRKYFSKDWYEELKDYLESKEFLEIAKEIIRERLKNTVYPLPKSNLLFKVFKEVPYNNVKVVILGQDPYHDGSYDGLAFSNTGKQKPSGSLRNILKEVQRDIYGSDKVETNYSLYRWAKQGVLLTNVSQTVIKGSAGSHLHYWVGFTQKVIEALNKKDNIIWMLWGKFSQGYENLIENKTHYIIKTGHPSPLNSSNPFVGCGCFSECNNILSEKKIKPIIW